MQLLFQTQPGQCSKSGCSAVSTFPRKCHAGRVLTERSSWGEEPLGMLGIPPHFGPFAWQAAAPLLPWVHPQVFEISPKHFGFG